MQPIIDGAKTAYSSKHVCLHEIFHKRIKNLSIQKGYFDEKCVIKETGSKVGCFVGFSLHSVTTTSAHTNVYRYPLFESDQIREQSLYAGKI